MSTLYQHVIGRHNKPSYSMCTLKFIYQRLFA